MAGRPELTHSSGELPEPKIEDYGVTPAGRLSAEEFNKMKKYVEENDGNIHKVVETAVFGIKFANLVEPSYPDPDTGIVTLLTLDRSVTILCELYEYTFYAKTDASIKIATTAYNGSLNLPYPVTLSIYRNNVVKKTLELTGSITTPVTYTDLYLGDILEPGTNSIKFSAYCPDMGLSAEDIIITVNFTNVVVVPTTTWDTLINTQNNELSLSYRVEGDLPAGLKKVLHLKLYKGSKKTDVYKTYYETVTGSNITITTGVAEQDRDYIAHGVHMVESYCSIETTDSPSLVVYTSASVFTRYMFAKDTTDTNNYLVIQNEVDEVGNYTNSKIFDYYIFKPYLSSGTITKDSSSIVSITFGLVYTLSGLSGVAALQTLSINTGNAQVLRLLPEAVSFDLSSPAYYNSYPTALIGTDDIMSRSYNATNDLVITLTNDASILPNLNPAFVLNPKLYNEADNNHIYNDKDANHAEIASSWNIKGIGIDGYIDNCLRLTAGDTITFTGFKPFRIFNRDSGFSSENMAMTLELDFKVYNVTNENNLIMQAYSEDSDHTKKGLMMYPLEAFIYTKNSNSSSALAKTNLNIQWNEDTRIHMIINIQPKVECNYGDNSISTIHSQSLVRVLINGAIEREFTYDSSAPSTSWPDNDENYQFPWEASLILGCSSADLDIYSIRYYEGGNSNFTSRQLLLDFIASQDSTEEKLAVYNRNNLTYASGSDLQGRISAELVKNLGKNVLIWHGPELKNSVTSLSDDTALTETNDGWWEIYRYNDDGTFDSRHSGTLCKTKKIKGAKSQGTTAKTYYYHNIQTKVKPNKVDGTDTVAVSLEDIDRDFITVSETYVESGVTYVDLSGTYSADRVVVTSNTIEVTDGWFSIDGKYRGLGYEVMNNTPFANKLVNKINYASSMQSHLQGGVMSYNDLHQAIVENTTGRAAKCVQPFFFFILADDNSNPIYRGLCTFGSGKADDATWGYTKSNGLCMIEGATNNAPLADMRVPWDDEVTNNFDETELDGWQYNGTVNIDLDKSKFETVDGYDVVPEETLTYIKNFFNYLYWHNPNLKAANENRSSFISTSASSSSSYDTRYSYVTSDYYLMRYDFVNSKWVDAGFKGTSLDELTHSYYQPRPLRLTNNPGGDHNYNDYEILSEITWNQTNPDSLVLDIIIAYANHALGRYNGGTSDYGLDLFVKFKSLVFHYVYVNYFIAGTDNCSKNTYYVLVPDTDVNGVTRHLFELHLDDLDTIFMTDNSGNQTKPYYIDRIRPYPEGSSESCYEGAMNVLFNLAELMFGERFDNLSQGNNTLTFRLMLNEIFRLMLTSKTSVWNFMKSYFFNVLEYFPEIAWNELAMVRYEYPHSIGATGRDNVRPISQSIGRLLNAEMQYMTRRIIMAASYSGYGALGGATTENIGISEASAMFGSLLINAKTVTFNPKAFLYIYPAYSMGDDKRLVYNNGRRVRLAPGELIPISITSTVNDRVAAILGSNYYSSMGDLGGSELSGTANFSGNRLTELKVNDALNNPKFMVGTIDLINMPHLQIIELANCSALTTLENLNTLKHLSELRIINTQFSNTGSIPKESLKILDLSGTTTNEVDLLNFNKLTTLTISKNTTSLTLINCPALTTLNILSGSNLTSVDIQNCPQLTTIQLPPSILNITLNNCPKLQSIVNTTVANSLSNLKTLSITLCNNSNFNKYLLIWRFCQDNASLNSLSIDTLHCDNFAYNCLDKILNILNVDTGTAPKSWIINMAEEGSTIKMVFDTKVAVLSKFGNVDSESNKVYMTYNATSALLDWSAAIRGLMYTRLEGSYDYIVVPGNSNLNHFSAFEWEIEDHTSVANYTFNEDSNTVKNPLTVLGLADVNEYVVIKCKLRLTNGNTITCESRKVYLWDRQAQLGDYVYADGDYSDEVDTSRTIIGICVYTDYTIHADDEYKEKYKQRRLAVSMKHMSLIGSYMDTSINTTSLAWGLCSNLANADARESTENANAVHKLYPDNQYGWYTLLSNGNLEYNMYNLSSLSNINTSGSKLTETTYCYSGAYTDYTGSEATFNLGTEFTTDEDTNNYAEYNTWFGRGYYKNEPEADLSARTLDSSLLNLTKTDPNVASSTLYSEGDIVSIGYAETLKIILHRNRILSDQLCDTSNLDMGVIPTADSNTTESTSLGNECAHDRYSAKHNELSSTPNKYYQFHYPAASACYAYEPTVTKAGELLAEKFKRHNWFLPPIGILTRICWYYKLASGGTGIHKNIFEDANTRGPSIGWESFKASYYWSSTEYSTDGSDYVGFSTGYANYAAKYYSYYVRALVAF